MINNIYQYTNIDKIVIVDNNSNDNSYEKLSKICNKLNNSNSNNKEYNNKIRLIKSDVNNGYSAGLNIGCKYLIEKYDECNIFVSNSDIIIKKEEDLNELIKNINEKNVIVAPNILEKNNISRGWKIPTPNNEIIVNLPIIEKKVLKKLKYDDSNYIGNVTKVDTVSGCFFLINSNHLKSINYFDENVFLYYEENIFGIKTKKLNKDIVIVNNTNMIHNHSISIDKSIKRINKVKIQKQSQIYFEKTYNNATTIQIFAMKVTAFISKILLSIKYLID